MRTEGVYSYQLAYEIDKKFSIAKASQKLHELHVNNDAKLQGLWPALEKSTASNYSTIVGSTNRSKRWHKATWEGEEGTHGVQMEFGGKEGGDVSNKHS